MIDIGDGGKALLCIARTVGVFVNSEMRCPLFKISSIGFPNSCLIRPEVVSEKQELEQVEGRDSTLDDCQRRRLSRTIF